jgi:hypothetical protein
MDVKLLLKHVMISHTFKIGVFNFIDKPLMYWLKAVDDALKTSGPAYVREKQRESVARISAC